MLMLTACAQNKPEKPSESLVTSASETVLRTGAERMERYLPELSGKKVAVCGNQTSVVGSAHLVDTLLSCKVNIVKLFCPEHGFRGQAEAGATIASGKDSQTGLPVVSLYGKNKKPTAEQLQDIDIVLFDLQDVGCRFYTYISTLHYVMEAAAENGVKVIVLDRPNPNGFYVDGPVLQPQYKSFVGMHPVPVVYGMTIGEYAQMINGEKWLENGVQCDLTVIPCLNYTHGTHCTLVLPPSPNLKNMRQVYLYSSTCFFEGTEVTTGRGTLYPFEIYGHPQMTDRGFSFTPRSIPGAKSPRYQDQLCYGVDLRGKPLQEIWDEQVNLDYLIDAYNNFPCDSSFFLRSGHFELQIGVPYPREMVLSGASAGEIRARWAEDVARFEEQRRPYLLYKE